jgi:prepilin-type N-terminal cleavage/methylation domain-containing protein
MRQSERGFSLIEIMTALAITMVVLGLTFKSFADALKVDDAMKLMTDVDQNLQSAATYLEKDLIDTGRNWPTGGIPLPNGAGSVAAVRPGTAADTTAGFPSTATLYPIIPGDGLGPNAGGATNTDTVTVCYMDGILGVMPVTSLTKTGTTVTMVLANTVTINTRPENTIAVGDIFYIVNGTNKVLQRVTALDAPSRTLTFAQLDDMKINQPGAAAGVVTPLLGLTDNRTQRLMMVTYFVQVSGGVPMLMRQLNNQTAQAVALGIRGFQLSYNVTTGTTTVGSATTTPNIYGDGYLYTQVDQAQVALEARSDRVLRMTNRYVSNDLVTQVGFRSVQTQQNYNLTP